MYFGEIRYCTAHMYYVALNKFKIKVETYTGNVLLLDQQSTEMCLPLYVCVYIYESKYATIAIYLSSWAI